MMIKAAFLIFASLLESSTADEVNSPVHLANPLQGTDSVREFSHGNTYPAMALPFPMNVWAPCTHPAKVPFFYQYRQNKIYGIRQTHQPSPWIRDYANFSLMPVFGKLAVTEQDRASEFRHETEIARPSYYSVHLDAWRAKMEVTPTERAASFRFTFEANGEGTIVLEAYDQGSEVEILPAQNKVIGICRNHRDGVPENFANYFVIEFDRPFAAHGTWTPETIHEGGTKLAAEHVGAYLKFKVSASEAITCKVASSYLSPTQAQRNLDREIGKRDFAAVLAAADATWNATLNRIQVEGGTEEKRRTFYSAIYRSVIFPHRFYELDKNEKPVYFSPYDGKVHQGTLYTDTGYWDTFRASHPLYNLLFPEISAEILRGNLTAYEQSGWLPSWSSPGHRPCMIGNHVFSLMVDAWVKGITSFDANKADGAWCEKFDPTEWGGPFTEGNSWHWAWSMFQDVPGLIKLMGGDEAFARKLDQVFSRGQM